MGDMVNPVMAVQSMDDDVLKSIKRDNISLDTYESFQQKFHKIGSTTYFDVIVPLPGESLETHLDGLRQLFRLDVDIIQNHNCRMLAGCELNSIESRKHWEFRTRYRLIHGDAGSYKLNAEESINCFEYEESLRETSSMSEADLFFLRKLHFLIDYCWNGNVYKPILKYLRSQYNVSPVDVFLELCNDSDKQSDNSLAKFWQSFEESSQSEWFDSPEAIKSYFADPTNFKRLIDGEFEKINVLFTIIAIRDFKPQFDATFCRIVERKAGRSDDIGWDCAKVTFARFPSLQAAADVTDFVVAPEIAEYFNLDQAFATASDAPILVTLKPGGTREKIKSILTQNEGMTISKILNTQGFSLRDLALTLEIPQADLEHDTSGIRLET